MLAFFFYLRPDLVSALPCLEVDDLPHGCVSVVVAFGRLLQLPRCPVVSQSRQ